MRYLGLVFFTFHSVDNAAKKCRTESRFGKRITYFESSRQDLQKGTNRDSF